MHYQLQATPTSLFSKTSTVYAATLVMITAVKRIMKIVSIVSILTAAYIFGQAESGHNNLCGGWDCRDGTCAYSGSGDRERCDGIIQCSDGSDEVRCDECNGFPCDDGDCTTFSVARCDGADDCADGSDEANCGVTALDLIIIVVVVLVVLFICCPLAIVIIVICCVCIFATNRRKLKLTNKTTVAKPRGDAVSTTKFETPYSLLPIQDDSNQRDQTDPRSQAATDCKLKDNQQSEFNTDSTDSTDPTTTGNPQPHVGTDSTDSVGDQQPLIIGSAKPNGDQQPPGPIND